MLAATILNATSHGSPYRDLLLRSSLLDYLIGNEDCFLYISRFGLLAAYSRNQPRQWSSTIAKVSGRSR